MNLKEEADGMLFAAIGVIVLFVAGLVLVILHYLHLL